MTPYQPKESLDVYLKTCSDMEYAEYIIATMTRGNSPLEFDKIQGDAIKEIRSRPHPAPAPSQPARVACIIDLHAYQHGNTLFEDIRACSGESCNYCGRFTDQHDAAIARTEREEALDLILRDLSDRSCIGSAIEQVEKERGAGWLRGELLKIIREQQP